MATAATNHGPCDTGDCARNFGGRDAGGVACTDCGFIHCDVCEGTQIVAESGDVEYDTCSACSQGAARCECGEPATHRYQGEADGEPECAACHAESEKEAA